MKIRKSLLLYMSLFLLVAIPVEVASYFAASLLVDRGLLFEVPSSEGLEEYLQQRDQLLGWPSPGSLLSDEFDSTGSRKVPAFPDPQSGNCAAVFGDSFTWGDEVSAEQSYPNVLSALLRCRVANFGVPGYGTDQSFLRYRDRITASAPVVVLGVWSENIVRNVNRYRGFLAPGRFGFKPRFLLNGEGVALVPLPSIDPGVFESYWQNPSNFENDWFVPGGQSGLHFAKFPFFVSVLKSFTHFKLRAAVAGRPLYEEFYDTAHPSQALPTTVAIVEQFVLVAKQRGQRPIVLLIPSDDDLQRISEGRAPPYQSLVDILSSASIEFIDAAPLLNSRSVDAGACALYLRCGGHLSPEGNRTLALAVAQHFWSSGIYPRN
jgi:hypothetical protein